MAQIKRSRNEIIFDGFNVAFMFLVALIMLYGFWNQISLSLSDPHRAIEGGLFLWPKGFSVEAYKSVFNSAYIWIGYANTILVTVGGTILGVLVTTLMAYPLSKKSLPGQKVLNFMVVFTMLFSGGMIPTYLTVKATGLINSRWALIIPVLISGFNIIITKNFFQNIPESIEESAKIDGANYFTIFFSIVLPLSKPVLATITLWISVMYWNDFFNAMMFLSDRGKYPLQLILKEIISASNPDELLALDEDSLFTLPETLKSASTIVATVPILMVYPFIQKHFAKGVMLGSVKG